MMRILKAMLAGAAFVAVVWVSMGLLWWLSNYIDFLALPEFIWTVFVFVLFTTLYYFFGEDLAPLWRRTEKSCPGSSPTIRS